ncbi:hypothetical protein VKT23_009554 [Stygiomarasmius scandens]|uniref:Uncharacterized protein n=1 Tax=Marasmiellus scandens TaxID=2682957 RepID=A0ABR1JE42_9AGAR
MHGSWYIKAALHYDSQGFVDFSVVNDRSFTTARLLAGQEVHNLVTTITTYHDRNDPKSPVGSSKADRQWDITYTSQESLVPLTSMLSTLSSPSSAPALDSQAATSSNIISNTQSLRAKRYYPHTVGTSNNGYQQLEEGKKEWDGHWIGKGKYKKQRKRSATRSSPSSASSRYSEDGKARIIVSPNPPLVNERDEECLEEKDTDDIESSGVLYLSPPLAASPAFYRYPDSPYPSSEAQSSANSTSTCSMSPSPRLPLTQSNQADGLTRAGLRLFESVHTQLASLDNESGRQPIILDKALKAYPRSPYPTATFDFDHQKLGDSDEEEDMYTDKVPRLGPVRANTIAVSTNHRGRDRTVKALSCSANAQTIPAEDTVITPVATSIPIAADSDAVQCPQCAVSVSRPEVIDIPVPISVSPESVASNVTNVSAVSGTSSLRNAFWQSLSLEEGPEEDVPASWFLGAPPPPKSTGKAMPIQVGSPKEVNKPDNSLGTPATNLLDFHSRLGLPTPPILLGTKDGDIIRWPESAASRSNLVDIPLSPFVSSQNQSSPRRLPALRASKAQERKAKRLTLPLDSGTLGTPTESEWLSWKSGFSASTRRSMSFDLTSDDGQPSSEINSIPFPVVMSPMPRTAKDRLPSFATAVSDLP